MAGSYADVPSRRIAWDADGTVGVHWIGQGSSDFNYGSDYEEISSAKKIEMNDEDNVVVGFSSATSSIYKYFCYSLIFPEKRDLYGHFIVTPQDGRSNFGFVDCEASADTTNGFDGTWVDLTHPNDGPKFCYPQYRTEIYTETNLGIRGVRWQRSGQEQGHNQTAAHWYGTITSGETPDRLLFVDDSTGLELTEPFDWGDVPRGSVLDKVCKIKNNSSTLQANDAILDFEALYGTSDTWYTAKEGVGGFGTTVTLTTPLGTGVSSSTITIRQSVIDAAQLGLNAARAFVTVGTWT